AQRVARVVVFLHRLVLALGGGFLVPHVAGQLVHQGGRLDDLQVPGGEQGGDAADAVGDGVVGLVDAHPVAPQLLDERGGGRVDHHPFDTVGQPVAQPGG